MHCARDSPKDGEPRLLAGLRVILLLALEGIRISMEKKNEELLYAIRNVSSGSWNTHIPPQAINHSSPNTFSINNSGRRGRLPRTNLA